PRVRTEPEEESSRRERPDTRPVPNHAAAARPSWVGRGVLREGVMMSTQTGPAANGRARKSLEYQLDRFDSILDGLADALNESVADAVKDAVGQAVRESVRAVVAELVANPDVARALAAAHGLTPPAPPPEPAAPSGPTWRDRMRARWQRLR